MVDAVKGGGPDLVDPHDLGVDVAHLMTPDGEEILLRHGCRSVRLAVRSGTFLEGPVHLRYTLEGMRDLGHQLMTLRRLVGLRRLKRLPLTLFPPERRAPRWTVMLRVLDARDAGASQREMAEIILGGTRDWRRGSDYLRLRVQRLVRIARHFADGGYLALPKSRPPL